MALALQRLQRLRIGDVDVGGIARETAREAHDDDVMGLAAEMAYHSILAIFPFLLLLAGLTAVVDNVFSVGNLTDRIVDKAGQVMPEDATSVLRGFTDEVVKSQGGWAIVVGAAGALWAASSAVAAAMKALNRAYDVTDDRGFVRKRLICVGITLLFSTLLLTAAGLIATGQVMAGGIGEALGWERQFTLLWNALAVPGALVLVGLAAAVLYWLAPNTGHAFRWITPGALLFVTGWSIFTYAFAFYISNFAAYNRTYGSLAAVFILMVWLNWSSVLLLMGGELNAVLARRHDAEYRAEQGARPPASGSKAQP
jgi:membrane protein